MLETGGLIVAKGFGIIIMGCLLGVGFYGARKLTDAIEQRLDNRKADKLIEEIGKDPKKMEEVIA
jgi:hypothetical protein